MIEKYSKKLRVLLSKKIVIQCYLDNKWIDLKEHHLTYIKNNNRGIEFKVLNKDNIISQFKLIQMPGCCGICISTGTYVNPKFRGKGVNIILNNFRIDIAKHLGYGLLMCTDLKSNTPQMKTLDKNGWKHIHEFKNPRTGNILNVTIKEL